MLKLLTILNTETLSLKCEHDIGFYLILKSKFVQFEALVVSLSHLVVPNLFNPFCP